MASSDGYYCEVAVSSGSLLSVPAVRLSVQLCPPAFATVQGGSDFHFANIGALHKCASTQAMRMLPCGALEGAPRLPPDGRPLRTLIDSELAPPSSGPERIGAAGRSAVRVAFRIPGRRAAASSPTARSGFRLLRRSARIAQERVPGFVDCVPVAAAVHRFRLLHGPVSGSGPAW